MRHLIYGFCILMVFFSCEKESILNDTPDLELVYSTPPVPVPDGTRFSANVAYDDHTNAVFDILMPESSQPVPLVVFIHGGGFVGGDKATIYKQNPDNIKTYLDNSIAFATINYQFRTSDPDSGIIVSLKDIKRCIQFIRYHASSFNIDKTRIACYGGSAGGGASIYLAFHPDMADTTNEDPVLRESTRLTAAGHLTSQCSYDPVVVVGIFEAAGIDLSAIPDLKKSLAADYGLASFDQFYTDAEVIALRKELNMLGWMTVDDPEFFVSNGNPNVTPTKRSEVVHHPLHAKILIDKAASIGLPHVSNIPSMNIFAANNETISDFMIRKLK